MERGRRERQRPQAGREDSTGACVQLRGLSPAGKAPVRQEQNNETLRSHPTHAVAVILGASWEEGLKK